MGVASRVSMLAASLLHHHVHLGAEPTLLEVAKERCRRSNKGSSPSEEEFIVAMTTESTDSSSLPRFTCITCRVAFRDAEIQRSHYKTDWHRYNLKRKVAELPPVSTEVFQEKVLAQREAAGATSETKHEVCEACRKHFTSRNSYESHLRSRKHREAVAAYEKKKEGISEVMNPKSAEDSVKSADEKSTDEGEAALDSAVVDSDIEPEPLETTECLFCPHQGSDMEKNLNHMSMAHGFFIPELDYLVDIKGLIEYLCEKVGIGNMCLYCNEKGKVFHSVESVQQHMVDRCHCKLFFEGDAALEYAEYYDYSKSYPPNLQEPECSGDDPTSKETQLPDTSLNVNDSLELMLPSGAKVGHRALKLFYNQHLPSQEQRKSALVSRLVSHYRALGWREMGKGESGMLRRRGEAWGKRMQKSRDMKLSVKANKLQPHLRPQVVF